MSFMRILLLKFVEENLTDDKKDKINQIILKTQIVESVFLSQQPIT